jgi:hypothetical protein
VSVLARLSAFALILLGCSAAVAGELRPLSQDRWYAALGGYWVFDSSTQVALGDPDLPLISARVDLTKDLAVDSTYAGVRLDGYWRFRPQHRAEFALYEVDRSGGNVISEEIRFEDRDGDEIVFNAGAQIATVFDVQVTRATYLYSFYRSDQVELGLGIGLYALDLLLALEGEAEVNGITTGFTRVDADVLAPLPVGSFRIDYSPAPRWTLRAAIDQFFISTGDLKGAFNDFRLMAEYQASRRVAVGLGYDRLQLDVEIDDEDVLGEAEAFWAGALVYLAYRY